MGKVTLLFAGKSYDTDVQSVRENQIVIFDGPYNMRQRMVVAGIAHTQSGYNYRLIDPETAEEHSADLIRPLRDKFGIGHYYDDEHPEFMDAAEVAALRTRADALKAEQEAARRAAAEDAERLRTIGAERLRQIVPDDAVAVIIGEQHESECDPYTDYFGSRIVRTVILGFSTHTRDLFPEMRKAAARFEGTAHLAERNAEYEHREKYSMGHGYYLGTHRYSGWQVSKESCRDKEGIIKRFAVVAGKSDNVCIENPAPVQTAAPETVADARVEIVEYSAKSIAVFGDTKPLRDTLRDLNGLFRACLTHDGTRCAGWIFSKRREQEVRSALAAYLHNNFGSHLFVPKIYYKGRRRRRSRLFCTTECPLTGYYMDNMILDPIYCFFTHPDDTTFYDLIECCLDTFFRACRDDARYCRSEEYFAELAESNAWEYLASGTAYHLIN